MEARREGLDLPERVRQSIATAVVEHGVQARMISTQSRDSMRPPLGHVVVAAPPDEIAATRGPARIVRQLEFYKTPYGPVVRLALGVYPMDDEPLFAATLLNISQVSGDAALSGLGRQKSLYTHFYEAYDGDLTYAYSKELNNGPDQRREAKKVLKMARDAYSETPEERRSFRWAVGIAENQFELPVLEPDDEV
ncbi:MAG: hypothetical protein ACFB50_01455 [Rubrobacteraceae bacterium]